MVFIEVLGYFQLIVEFLNSDTSRAQVLYSLEIRQQHLIFEKITISLPYPDMPLGFQVRVGKQ